MRNVNDDRVVVLRPGLIAAATVVGNERTPRGFTAMSLVSAHDALVFIERGEGYYRTGCRSGVLRPNTLIAAPAGAFTCILSDDRDAYVLTLRDAAVTVEDQRAFTPFCERKLSTSEVHVWRVAVTEFVDRVAGDRLETTDVARLKNAAAQLIWRRESQRETVSALLESLWSRLDQQLTVEDLAKEIGYTMNHLNDLTTAHTGRPVGRWITDMRMARARVSLERTDMSIVEVASVCGYIDPAYFSRAFRREHGVNPLAWRIAARPSDRRHAKLMLPTEALHPSGVPRVAPLYSFAC